MQLGLLLVINTSLLSQSAYCYCIIGFFNFTLSDSTYPVTLKVNMQHYFSTVNISYIEFSFNLSSLYYPSNPQRDIDYVLHGDFNLYQTHNITRPADVTVMIRNNNQNNFNK